MASLPHILRKGRVAINHSCSQFQTLDAVEEVIGPVMCCQGKGSEVLESGCKVKQIVLLLLPSISTRSEISELLFALVQFFIYVRFDLARQRRNLVPSIFKPYIREFLSHHFRQDIPEPSLKRLNANAVFLELRPGLLGLEKYFLVRVSIKVRILKLRLPRVSDNRPAEREFVASAY